MIGAIPLINKENKQKSYEYFDIRIWAINPNFNLEMKMVKKTATTTTTKQKQS